MDAIRKIEAALAECDAGAKMSLTAHATNIREVLQTLASKEAELAAREAEIARLREALSLLTAALENPISVQMTRAQLAFRGRAALTKQPPKD